MPELPPVTNATLPVIVPANGALLLWLMALIAPDRARAPPAGRRDFGEDAD